MPKQSILLLLGDPSLDLSILYYLSDNLLEVALETESPLLYPQADNLFWRLKVAQKVQYNLPYGAKPEYSTFRRQYERILELPQLPENIISTETKDKYFLAPLVVDLGEGTVPWFSRFVEENQSRKYDPQIFFDLFSVFVLAWGNPRMFDYFLEYRDGEYLSEIYFEHMSEPYSLSISEIERTYDLPTLQGLVKYFETVRELESVDDMNASISYVSELKWSLKEVDQVDYIYSMTPPKQLINLVVDLITFTTDPYLADYLLKKIGGTKALELLPRILDYLLMNDNRIVYEEDEDISPVQFRTFKHLLKSQANFLIPQSLGKHRIYDKKLIRILQELGKFYLVDYRSQLYKPQTYKAAKIYLTSYVDFEYNGDTRRYFEAEKEKIYSRWKSWDIDRGLVLCLVPFLTPEEIQRFLEITTHRGIVRGILGLKNLDPDVKALVSRYLPN